MLHVLLFSNAAAIGSDPAPLPQAELATMASTDPNPSLLEGMGILALFMASPAIAGGVALLSLDSGGRTVTIYLLPLF